MSAPDYPTTLPGLSLAETCTAAERVNTTYGSNTFNFCWGKCITHFGEDAIPYHIGEKGCFDRCFNKVGYTFHMAKTLKEKYNSGLKDGTTAPQWMRDLGAGKQ